MVNTLAGNYQSAAMVVMRNLRLPELDKNRNIEQQKALIFESENCKYDVILGAPDFLTKTGIDVKYSPNTIEWFENELPGSTSIKRLGFCINGNHGSQGTQFTNQVWFTNSSKSPGFVPT